jgi:DNA-binding XRE family transcriptional regulator
MGRRPAQQIPKADAEGYSELNNFAELCIWLRQEEDLRQEDFAKAIGAHNNSVHKWENSKQNPPFNRVLEILKHFGYRIEVLPLAEKDLEDVTNSTSSCD